MSEVSSRFSLETVEKSSFCLIIGVFSSIVLTCLVEFHVSVSSFNAVKHFHFYNKKRIVIWFLTRVFLLPLQFTARLAGFRHRVQLRGPAQGSFQSARQFAKAQETVLPPSRHGHWRNGGAEGGENNLAAEFPRRGEDFWIFFFFQKKKFFFKNNFAVELICCVLSTVFQGRELNVLINKKGTIKDLLEQVKKLVDLSPDGTGQLR